MSTSKTADGLVADLERAADRLDDARERVADFGEDDLQQLATVYEEFVDVLERYEDEVTDDGGDYQTNIEFQSQIAEVNKHISEDLLLSETFEECDEYLQQKWFSESDFEHVYEQLEPVADLVGRVYERDDALEAYRETRQTLEYRIREFDEEIRELERLSRLGSADLDAPTDRLRDPIDRYNEAVTAAFQTARQDWSARELLSFVVSTRAYPLLEFEQPPGELVGYLDDAPPGTEPVPTVIEYADYSRSKLEHYVDDPAAFEEAVGGKQTYLSRLDASPLRVGWPPPAAGVLEYRCRALTSAVNRLEPAVVEQLRDVAALPRETDYERLRDSVLAREKLTDEERRRIDEEDIEAELDSLRTQQDRLEAALEEYPAQ